MDSFYNNLIQEHAQINKAQIHFGNSSSDKQNSLLNCAVSDKVIQDVMTKFLKYPNIKTEFKHIVARDKELFIFKEGTKCLRKYVISSKFITLPDTNTTVCLTTEKNEKLREIAFPSSNQYQKNVNCNEYIFTIHEKIKLIIHMENNTNVVFLDIIVDDYIDTTVQYLKGDIINQITQILCK